VAFNNNLAALLITTNQHRAAAYPHQGMFMDMDTRAVLAPLTKWNAVVHDARRLPELVRTAFREALTGRPGPVHLDIPQDVLAQVVTWRADEFALPPARYRSSSGPRRPPPRWQAPRRCCSRPGGRCWWPAAAWCRPGPTAGA
jgi:thiamine pyrophosphate-dependent acetolactate synthase large subunit-like protein